MSIPRTGATGYIGGDFLALAVQTHPDWDITALVRNSDKGALVTSKYPHVKVVIGSLESAVVLETESKKADIVYRKYILDGPLEACNRLL